MNENNNKLPNPHRTAVKNKIIFCAKLAGVLVPLIIIIMLRKQIKTYWFILMKYIGINEIDAAIIGILLVFLCIICFIVLLTGIFAKNDSEIMESWFKE